MSIEITRSSSGLYRWVAAPAATAFFNREKEIDSIRLFDRFIERINKGSAYPYLTFWHQGPKFRMGQADYIERAGRSLILSGTWDETSLAEAARQTIEREKGSWGTSIKYWAYAKENMLIVRATDFHKVPVYTDGLLIECSILPETRAANIKTLILSHKLLSDTLQ